MKRAKKLGNRYIRTLSDALASAFNNPRFLARVTLNVTRNNALLARLNAAPFLQQYRIED